MKRDSARRKCDAAEELCKGTLQLLLAQYVGADPGEIVRLMNIDCGGKAVDSSKPFQSRVCELKVKRIRDTQREIENAKVAEVPSLIANMQSQESDGGDISAMFRVEAATRPDVPRHISLQIADSEAAKSRRRPKGIESAKENAAFSKRAAKARKVGIERAKGRVLRLNQDKDHENAPENDPYYQRGGSTSGDYYRHED